MYIDRIVMPPRHYRHSIHAQTAYQDPFSETTSVKSGFVSSSNQVSEIRSEGTVIVFIHQTGVRVYKRLDGKLFPLDVLYTKNTDW